MGFLADSHEPKELSPSEMRDDRFIDIHKQGNVNFDRPKFLDYFFGKRYVVFSTEELRVLISHRITPMNPTKTRWTRKEYKIALKQQEQARIWLDEEKRAKAQQLNEEMDKN